MLARIFSLVGYPESNPPKSSSAARKFAAQRRIANHGKVSTRLKPKVIPSDSIHEEKNSTKSINSSQSTTATLRTLIGTCLPVLATAITCGEKPYKRMDFQTKHGAYAFIRDGEISTHACYQMMLAVLTNECDISALGNNDLLESADIGTLCNPIIFNSPISLATLGNTLTNLTTEITCLLGKMQDPQRDLCGRKTDTFYYSLEASLAALVCALCVTICICWKCCHKEEDEKDEIGLDTLERDSRYHRLR